jgi:beta-phosphoglucomutase-like phosphatase (HAD superfamily)
LRRSTRRSAAATDSEAWLLALHQLKSEIYAQLVRAGGIALRPGVARLLDELRGAGVRLAIATTTTPSSLDSCCSPVLATRPGRSSKSSAPAMWWPTRSRQPDIYRWVLRQMQLPPQACLAVEDSLPGVRAATAAGLPTLITVNAYSADDNFVGALSVVADLGEPGAPARHLAGAPLAGGMRRSGQLRLWHRKAVSGMAC